MWLEPVLDRFEILLNELKQLFNFTFRPSVFLFSLHCFLLLCLALWEGHVCCVHPSRLTGLPAIDSVPAAALVWRLVILFRTRSCSSSGGYGTGRALRKVSSVNQASDAGWMTWGWVIKSVRTRMKVEWSLSEGETRDKSQIKCLSHSYEEVSCSVSCSHYKLKNILVWVFRSVRQLCICFVKTLNVVKCFLMCDPGPQRKS